MRLSLLLTALTASGSISLASTGDTCGPTAPTIINPDNYPNSTLEATAWALIYTYPLAIFANFAGNVLRNVHVNQIYNQRTLATPDDPGVIKPNVDTLYSRVVLDLSSNDVVLTVPNISDRYYVYPIYDPYGNNIAEIGVVNGNRPGDYLIRRAEDVAIQPGFSNSSSSTPSQYEGIVTTPTTYATMLIRIFLLHNTTEDLNIVHTYQNASKLAELPRNTSAWQSSHPPALNTTSPNGTLLGIQTPEAQFEQAARWIDFNQPENHTDRARVSGILARAGLYNGQYHPQGVDLPTVVNIANKSITAYVQAAANVRNQGNGWELQTPENQGNYGTRYASAAYVALAGYQQQTVRQTLYPGYDSLGFTSQFTLAANQSMLVTFRGRPQLQQFGFWSLSLYGSDQYLIPNSLNRFEVGDRTTSLVFQSGGFVYGDNASASDGPFQVLVQSKDIQPPANWTGNWLPAEETFSWILRWYVPQDAMTNGSYVYPVLQNITAIRG